MAVALKKVEGGKDFATQHWHEKAKEIQKYGEVTKDLPTGWTRRSAATCAPPRGREEVPMQIGRLLEAHKQIMQDCHDIAEAADKAGDDGTNDMVVSDVLRANESQSWFIGQHLVDMSLTHAE